MKTDKYKEITSDDWNQLAAFLIERGYYNTKKEVFKDVKDQGEASHFEHLEWEGQPMTGDFFMLSRLMSASNGLLIMAVMLLVRGPEQTFFALGSDEAPEEWRHFTNETER